MKYTTPDLETIRFENGDILTESEELPIVPAEEEDQPMSFGKSSGD